MGSLVTDFDSFMVISLSWFVFVFALVIPFSYCVLLIRNVCSFCCKFVNPNGEHSELPAQTAAPTGPGMPLGNRGKMLVQYVACARPDLPVLFHVKFSLRENCEPRCEFMMFATANWNSPAVSTRRRDVIFSVSQPKNVATVFMNVTSRYLSF